MEIDENSETNDPKNPHNICTWKEKEICKECEVEGKLQCHEDYHYSIWFGTSFFLFMIPAMIGIFRLIGINSLMFGLALGIWIVYIIYFFLIWEPKMLCSHCPYYAEGETKILHCYANHGFLKTATYNPYPLSKSEKIQFVVGVILLLGIPFPFLLIGEQYIYFAISFIGAITWFVVLYKKICTDCLNFSCPFNRVPEKTRNEFIKKNPIIKKAWEEKGYKIE